MCVCIEVYPSHTTNAEPISTLVTSVEAPCYALHPPLPASKAVLSSWSLVVICALITTGVTGITAWYDNRLVVPGTRHDIREHSSIYVREYSVYTGTRASHRLFATYWYHVLVWIYEYNSIVTHHVPVIISYTCKVLTLVRIWRWCFFVFCTSCCCLHYWCE